MPCRAVPCRAVQPRPDELMGPRVVLLATHATAPAPGPRAVSCAVLCRPSAPHTMRYTYARTRSRQTTVNKTIPNRLNIGFRKATPCEMYIAALEALCNVVVEIILKLIVCPVDEKPHTKCLLRTMLCTVALWFMHNRLAHALSELSHSHISS